MEKSRSDKARFAVAEGRHGIIQMGDMAVAEGVHTIHSLFKRSPRMAERYDDAPILTSL